MKSLVPQRLKQSTMCRKVPTQRRCSSGQLFKLRSIGTQRSLGNLGRSSPSSISHTKTTNICAPQTKKTLISQHLTKSTPAKQFSFSSMQSRTFSQRVNGFLPKYITDETPLYPKVIVTKDIDPKVLNSLTRSPKDHPLYDHMTAGQKNQLLRSNDERFRNQWPYWLDLPDLEKHLRAKAKKMRVIPAVRRGDYGESASNFYRKHEWVPAILQGNVEGKGVPSELLLVRQRYFISEYDRTGNNFFGNFYLLEIDGQKFPAKLSHLAWSPKKIRVLSANFTRATNEAVSEWQKTRGEDNSIWHPDTQRWITPHVNSRMKIK